MSTSSNDRIESQGAQAHLTAISHRRSFVGHLLAMSMLPAVLSGWWLRASDTVVVRSGWVLSKDD